MGDRDLNILCYSDDAVLLAESEDDLQRLLHRLTCTVKSFNMTVSVSKTNCMTMSRPLRYN